MIIFCSFQVGLNFFIIACLFLNFKNALKKKIQLFYCFLYFKLIFLMFLYVFNFVFKYIEIGSGCAARLKENILSWVMSSKTHLSWVLPHKDPKQLWVQPQLDPLALAPVASRTHHRQVLSLAKPNTFNFFSFLSCNFCPYNKEKIN